MELRSTIAGHDVKMKAAVEKEQALLRQVWVECRRDFSVHVTHSRGTHRSQEAAFPLSLDDCRRYCTNQIAACQQT